VSAVFERFAQATRAAVDDARYEAARRGDRRIGTEHLLISLLEDEATAAAVGVDAAAAREAAARLDRAALAAIGVELGGFEPQGRARLAKRAPFTAGAKQVLTRTLAHAAAEKARAITPRHMLLAVLERPEPDAAAALLAALDVDVPAVRSRLLPG
jgi:ATP-dependent Clp protease ATP-binding subunit ClpA